MLLLLSFLLAGCAERREAKAQKEVAAAHEPGDVPPAQREAKAREDITAAHERGDARPPAPAATKPRVWRGLDLAAAPVSSDASKLPDLWEARPPGSRSFEIRDDVTVIRPHDVLKDGSVYWVKARDLFYVQHDSTYSSTLHYYGPFKGDPNQVLKPPPTEPAGQ